MIDEKDISNKNPTITLFLLLIFGRFGAHRFYVGKYISGIFFLLIGGTSITMQILDFKYHLILRIVYLAMMIFDIYALYSDSFTDGKDKILTYESKTLVYNSNAEREQILFTIKLNTILCVLVAIAAYIAEYLIQKFLL